MTTLLDLIDVIMPPAATPQEKFERFHSANPIVYLKLQELTEQMVERGRQRIGIGMLFEVLRWNFYLRADPEEDFKLDNNYRAFYSRLLMERHPEWGQIFELRIQHAPSRMVPK